MSNSQLKKISEKKRENIEDTDQYISRETSEKTIKMLFFIRRMMDMQLKNAVCFMLQQGRGFTVRTTGSSDTESNFVFLEAISDISGLELQICCYANLKV